MEANEIFEVVQLRKCGTNLNGIHISKEALEKCFSNDRPYFLAVDGTYYPHGAGVLLDKVVGELYNLRLDEDSNLVATCRFYDVPLVENQEWITKENIYGAGIGNIVKDENGVNVVTNYEFTHAYISPDAIPYSQR